MGTLTIMDLASTRSLQNGVLKQWGMAPLWCPCFSRFSHVNTLTIDRYLTVAYPFRLKIWCTKKNTSMTIFVIWVICVGAIIVSAITAGLQSAKHYLKDTALSASATVILLYSLIVYRVTVERRRRLSDTNAMQLYQSQRRSIA